MNLHEIMLAAQLAGKNNAENVDLSDYYTKSQIDDLISGLKNYDDTGVKADIAKTTEQTALNRSTLGYQRKNLLQNNCTTKTEKGITATVNADKSITLTGSNTTSSPFVMYWNMQTGLSSQHDNNKKWIPDGNYIISGGKAGVKIQVFCAETYGTTGIGTETVGILDKTFSVSSSDKYVWSRLLIDGTADFGDGTTIYPMIRPADITDDTYEPYRPSVEEYIAGLEERIAALESVNLTANSLNSSLNTAEINVTEEEKL